MKRSARKRRYKVTDGITLEDLDGERWGEPPFDSYVVRTCHALRRKPVNTLTDEELRLAIGQGIGLIWLIPLALQRLAEDPFRCGDFYEGDLLASISRVAAGYWAEHPEDKVVLASKVVPAALGDDRLPEMTSATRQAVIDLRTMSE